MADLILQRFVMPLEMGPAELYYRCAPRPSGPPLPQPGGRRSVALPRDTVLRADTWFNGFFERYWWEYTRLEALDFHARISGTGTLRLFRRPPEGGDILLREIDFCGTDRHLIAEIPAALDALPTHGLLFFEITPRTPVTLHRAEWVARDAGEQTARLVVGYCTCNRPAQLLRNVAALLADADVAEVLARIVVVDQGRDKVRGQLSRAALADVGDRLRLIEQDNFGGAGGFTRCLLEARREVGATHVLLMDDDVIAEPESVSRAAAFLSLIRNELAVGGYMLDTDRPREVFAVGNQYRPERLRIDEPIRHRVDRSGGLSPFLEIRRGHFSGWWFFAFPLAALERVGLPLPLFLRGDDVEFGYRLLRAGVPTVTPPGVAVWHESFERKGRGWQPYYELRNLLVVGARHFPAIGAVRIVRLFFSRLLDELLIYDYYEAWLLCEAVRAYLRGPGVLRASPLVVHRRLLAAGEDWAEARWPREGGRLERTVRPPSGFRSSRLRRWLLVLGNAARSSPSPAAPPRRILRPADEQWYGVGGADVVAVDETHRDDLVLLRRSRSRFLCLLLRGLALTVRLLTGHRRATRLWREGVSSLTSQRFWSDYLDLPADACGKKREQIWDRRQTTRQASQCGKIA